MLSPINWKLLEVNSLNLHIKEDVIVKRQTVSKNTVNVSMPGSNAHIYVNAKTVSMEVVRMSIKSDFNTILINYSLLFSIII